MGQAIHVSTYVGQEQGPLANLIHQSARHELAVAGASDWVVFDDAVHTAHGLARTIAAQRATVLHIVSHANRSGDLTVDGLWGDLRLTPEALADMLRDRGVKVVVATTCHGARIAKELVDRGVVEVAVGANAVVTADIAQAFAQGFYHGVALGRGALSAARDGVTFAKPYMDEWDGAFEIFPSDDAPDDPLLTRPLVHLVGDPKGEHADAVDEIVAAMKPYRVFHISRSQWGDDRYGDLDASLRSARIIMVLFEGEAVSDYELLEEVRSAVEEKIAGREVRLFPLILEGDRRSYNRRDVPFGLRRLVPAFLHEKGIDGSYAKLAERLKQLL